MAADYAVPMLGGVEVVWNLGVEEDGEIRGNVDLVRNGESVSRNIILFNRQITAFSDDNLEQAALLALAILWRDDLKPFLLDQMYAAFVEQRERCGGYKKEEESAGDQEDI